MNFYMPLDSNTHKPAEVVFWERVGGQMPLPKCQVRGGQNRVLLPPTHNISENFFKKGDFSRRLRHSEKIFPKNPLLSEILPPPHNLTQLRLWGGLGGQKYNV